MATEWISRQSGSICLTLRLCRLPMKSQAKASPQRSCLAARSCWRFSPTRRTPASASAPISSSGTYLVATRISTPSPARSRTSARFAATFAGSMPWISSGHLRPSLDPGEPRPGGRCGRVAAVREEELRLAAGAEAGGLDLLDPGLEQEPPRDLGQVEHAAVGDAVAEVGEGGEHLVADLVAAGTDPGADRGVGGADRLGALGEDPGGEPAPAAVQHRHSAGARESDRQAVGDEDERRQAGLGDDVAVDLGRSALPGVGERARLLRAGVEGELGAVDLRPIGTCAGSRPSAAASRWRFSTTASSSSSVRTPRLRLSNGGSLTPPRRVAKAARAPPRSASSQRTPSLSRHSMPNKQTRLAQRSRPRGPSRAPARGR